MKFANPTDCVAVIFSVRFCTPVNSADYAKRSVLQLLCHVTSRQGWAIKEFCGCRTHYTAMRSTSSPEVRGLPSDISITLFLFS